jgi:DNA-binding NtrC family response regulator
MLDTKLGILFVDDEPKVLSVIERQLRKDRTRWEMVFALGGQHGLDEIRRRCFAAVVSDFRMPVVNGVTLLNAIADAWPPTARIMLSGDAEALVIARAVPKLQELLIKPCDATTLRGAIERSIGVMRGRG